MRIGIISKFLVLAGIGFSILVVFGQACSDDLGGVGEQGRTRQSSSGIFLMNPQTAAVAYGATQTFSLSGGIPPYQVSIIAGGAGTVAMAGSSSVVYTAPASGSGTVQIQIVDSSGQYSGAVVTIGSGFAISPLSPSVAANATLTFNAVGGTPPYSYIITSGGGVFNLNVFTAPATAQTVSVTATDSAGNSAQTTITVTAPAQMMFNVFNPRGCNGAYCSCVTPGQPGVPYSLAADAICKARGYTSALSFTTQGGPVGQIQCSPISGACFTNANSVNIVCSTVTCQ